MENLKGRRAWVRFPIPRLYGQEVDLGQVVLLRESTEAEERLVRLGYVELVKGKAAVAFNCRVCGSEFVDQRTRDAHGDKRHAEPANEVVERAASPRDAITEGSVLPSSAVTDEADELLAEQDRAMAGAAPLHLDKTLASQGGSVPVGTASAGA